MILNENRIQWKNKIPVFTLFLPLCLWFLSGHLMAHPNPEDFPNIKFENRKIDFGRVKQGNIVTDNFIFENAGDSLLIINKIRTSCGCTAALASKKRLRPGEKGRLKVSFNTRGYSGNVTKYIYIYTNDPQNIKSMLSVSANVEVPPGPKIQINRTSMDIGLILEGEEIHSELNIKNTGENKLEVNFSHRNARFLHRGKDMKQPLKIVPGGQKKVEINMGSPEKTGPVREYILLKTNDPLRRTLSFHINGYIISEEQLKELFEKYGHLIRDKS